MGDGISRIYGLDEVMTGELVEFEDGIVGIALNLKSNNNLGVVLLGDNLRIQEGSFVNDDPQRISCIKKLCELTLVTGVLLAVLIASFGVTGCSLPRD